MTYILMLLDLFPSITRQEVATILGVSLSTVKKELQELRKKALIKRDGSDKTGEWRIIKSK